MLLYYTHTYTHTVNFVICCFTREEEVKKRKKNGRNPSSEIAYTKAYDFCCYFILNDTINGYFYLTTTLPFIITIIIIIC